MEKNVADFLEALKNNPKLKSELHENIKSHSSKKNAVYELSLEEQVKLICDVVVPFAESHGFKLSLADIILGDDMQELTDSSLEDVSGGFHLNKKFLAGTLLALQTLTSAVPSSALADNKNVGHSGTISMSSSASKSQVAYDSIVNILKKKGNSMRPISAECPFNEVDGMILSTISYVPLNCVPTMNSDMDYKDITIGEWGKCFSAYFNEFDKDVSFNNEDAHRVKQYSDILKSKNVDAMTGGRIKLLELVAQCPRYKNIKIGNFLGKYVEYKEKSNFYEQFAAVTYTLEDGTKVVNFRGTDATLAGWKEDLDLSWSKTIPAQEDAIKYLEKIYNSNPNAKYIVTGHSKGGNLAQYSAFCLSSKNKNFMKSVDRVYNYDGPGLNKDTISAIGNDVFDSMSKKLINFIPQSSMIGRILSETSRSKFICVYSSVQKSTDVFGQHDALTWNIAYDYEKSDRNMKFKSHNIQVSSDFMARATSSFMNKVDKNNAMRFFVQWLFDFIVRNKISIQGDQSLQDMCGNIFYNYFVKNKTYSEIIYSVLNPGKVLRVDDAESRKFKNVATAAYKSFLHAYWERHVDINREMGIPEEINKSIEEMVDSGCSFERIYKLINVTVDKVLTWQNIKNFFKKLYS